MLQYNAPDGDKSSIDKGHNNAQMQTYHVLKKALIDAKREQFFSPLADTKEMPKHFGKKIKVHHYIPLLDDRNINDQGIDAAGVTIANGNLYGSSKDIGAISGKLPVLTENGGRVNRVGFARMVREGSLFKFGFFHEFTQESMDFDSDAELMSHLSRELLTGATQLTEDILQKDLLAAAGTIFYAGAATNNGQITAEGATPSKVDYEDLMRLSIMLDENRTPKQTTIITGSRMVDTKTIPQGRVMFVGSELIPLLRKMKDLFDEPAFIPVRQYGDAGTLLNGEIGSIDEFRIVVVPQMLHWAGVGANVGTNPGFRASGGKYNVYPMLVVGDESFTTIGFQTSGDKGKFSITTKMPGKETADRNDPYGETGFSSIKWYYGFMALRPERIALIKTVAPI